MALSLEHELLKKPGLFESEVLEQLDQLRSSWKSIKANGELV